MDLGVQSVLVEPRARHPSPRSRPGGGTYLVVGGVGGCEVGLVRTVDLVHNIQTAHGSPQWRQFRVLLSTLGRRSAGMLHGRRLDPSSGVIGGGARGCALRGSGSSAHVPLSPLQFQPRPRSGTEAPRLQLVGI